MRFYGLGQAFCEPVRVKRRLIAMNGPRGSGDFARDKDSRRRATPALAAIGVVDGFPDFGSHRGH
ncbi:MAG: hypothetical protein WBO24_09400, partial [Nitrospirales bacterium]